jgi:hypothetical protein
MLVYVNGEIVPKEEAKISVFDHGYLYGDGIFEGIRVYEGNVFRLKEHIDRLYDRPHHSDDACGADPRHAGDRREERHARLLHPARDLSRQG